MVAVRGRPVDVVLAVEEHERMMVSEEANATSMEKSAGEKVDE